MDRRWLRLCLFGVLAAASAGCADAAHASAAEHCVASTEEVFETERAAAPDPSVVLVPWALAAAACLESSGWTCTSGAHCRSEDFEISVEALVAEELD